jgi:hypothetical protein
MRPEGGPTGKGGDLGVSTMTFASSGVAIGVDGLSGCVSGSIKAHEAIRGSESGGVDRRSLGSPLVESSMNCANDEGPILAREAYDPKETFSRRGGCLFQDEEESDSLRGGI